jgi:predicted ATPase
MSHEDQPRAARQPEVLIRRVRLRNFRSIAYCDVELEPLTVLVGRNGSGKSNFVDALALVRETLRHSFDWGVGYRGGFHAARFLGADESDPISIELDLEFRDGRRGLYGLDIHDPRTHRQYRAREWLKIYRGEDLLLEFLVKDDRLTTWFVHEGFASVPVAQGPGRVAVFTRENVPPAAPDRPYLSTIAVVPNARDVYYALQGIASYNLEPRAMRLAWSEGGGKDLLEPHGSNIAGVLERLQSEQPETMAERVNAYLQYIAPSIDEVRSERLDSFTVLAFYQKILNRREKLSPLMVSDGTLRALGCLVAVAQQADWGPPIRLVAIEEPEDAIHPAALAGLMAAFDEATVEKQVILTTHSPALLDRMDLESHRLLVVETGPDGTRITPPDRGSLKSVQEKLTTFGELLSYDRIETDWRYLDAHKPDQVSPVASET